MRWRIIHCSRCDTGTNVEGGLPSDGLGVNSLCVPSTSAHTDDVWERMFIMVAAVEEANMTRMAAIIPWRDLEPRTPWTLT